MHLWAVRDVRARPLDVRGQMLDVIEAAERRLDRDGKRNRLGRELDELAEVLDLDR